MILFEIILYIFNYFNIVREKIKYYYFTKKY